MERSERELAARARRAYELGRLGFAARVLMYVVPIVALAFMSAAPATMGMVGIAGFLGIFAVGMIWYGGAPGRAVGPGLLAGMIPLVVSIVLRATDYCCMGGACSPLCLPVCMSAGLVAGIGVGLRASEETEGRSGFALSGVLFAALTGALGCVGMGLWVVGGMAAALALASAPLAAVGIRLRRG